MDQEWMFQENRKVYLNKSYKYHSFELFTFFCLDLEEDISTQYGVVSNSLMR